MKQLGIHVLLIIACAGTTLGGEANVIAVDVRKTGEQTYRFDVTVKHADQGWEHYTDRWDVIAPDGEILASRVLAHPHTNEQPFTRSLSGVKIPVEVHHVMIRAHDSVHACGGKTLRIALE